MKIIQRIAIERPISTFMFYFGLVLLGSIAFNKLEVNLLPDLEFPRLTIVTIYSNSAPQEVENLITKPITDAVGTVSGINKIYSESLEGLSFVTLQFSWGTNIDFAAMEVREKLDLIRSILPEDAAKSIVTKFDPNQDPVVELIFFPKKLSNPKNLKFFLRTEIKNYLDRINGVAAVQFAGGYKKEVKVEVDPSLMISHKLSLAEIQQSLISTNMNYSAGHITVGNKDILIRTIGEYENLKDIAQTVVGRDKNGIAIRLSKIARVENSYRERTGLARYNGKECVIAMLFKEAGKNTVEVSENIKQEVKKLSKKFGKFVAMRIVYDQSRFIKSSINNILNALMLGGLLAFFFLVLFLRNIRSPLILLTSVPISIITTFLLMYWKGLSINLMTLGGLSFGIGMLFDTGNVVLSAIERNIESGLSPKEASLKGAEEVTGSVSTAIITTIIVFLPIVFLKGVIGVVFAEMALTICFSLLISLLVSLTLLPMLSSLRKKAGKKKKNSKDLSHFSLIQKIANTEEKLKNKYEKSLNFCLNNPKTIYFFILSLMSVSIYFLPEVKQEFIPKVDTGEFSIKVSNPKGTSLKLTSDVVNDIEKILTKSKLVKGVVSRIGCDEDQILTRKGGDFGTHQATIRVVLDEGKNVSTKSFVEKIRKKINFRKEIEITFDLSGDVLAKILSPEAKAITLEISGDDIDILREIGQRVMQHLDNINGIVDLKSSLEEMGREYHINFHPEKLASFNLSHSYISGFLKTAIKGEIATQLRIQDEEVGIRLQYQKADRKSIDKIKEYILKISDSQYIFLSEVINIKQESGYSSILRVGQNRINRITGDISLDNQTLIFDKLNQYISNLKLPVGYEIYFGGERENIEKSLKELGFAIVLALILIYMVLASQFQSIKFPVILMGSIPLILIGIIPGLLFFDKSFNVYTFIGIILLIGMVVDSSALLYEYFELHREEGRSIRESVLESGKIILRPLIMNSGTTILGLLPIALELGEGTELQSPMAITVIGGIIISSLLSLFLITTLIYFTKKKEVNEINR